ncbi:hypothetical protein AVEN_8693-1 [Araneus ventricosus]|uniref:Uncharacterized protein n=1 Tax=Araneus ventricosus TaxID=182803 RepID=A0A4Y2VWF0_ARAVE|nr:hypothetical protein AVEN_8693-1 [Araneus ventricosus]
MLSNLSQVVSRSPQREIEHPKAATVQSRRNPTSLLLSPKTLCLSFSVAKFTDAPGFNALKVVPPIGLKRDVAKLRATAAKLSDLEPRSTTTVKF